MAATKPLMKSSMPQKMSMKGGLPKGNGKEQGSATKAIDLKKGGSVGGKMPTSMPRKSGC